MRPASTLLHALLLVVLAAAAPPSGAPQGVWRAWLESPGGSVPFGLEIQEGSDGFQAWLINGPERIAVPRTSWTNGELLLDIDYYDSRITCRPVEGGAALEGEWSKRGRKDTVEMVFKAAAGKGRRFDLPGAEATAPPATGAVSSGSTSAATALPPRWAAKFSSSDEAAVAVLHGSGSGEVLGTFMTPTGDYRFLAGDFDGRLLRLSCFDGTHAFLFKAELQPDGSLSGDFWSSDAWHETWTAHPDPTARLPEAIAVPQSTNPLALGKVTLPDLDGQPRRLDDPAFAGKARIIEIFGSWCPNCRDATQLLIELDAKYQSRGLSILGLAFEYGDDPQRHAAQVKTYVQRLGVSYPVLVAGEADRNKAAQLFPTLGAIKAFPTTIFLDREGRVRAVHSGFCGPATGDEYAHLRADFEKLIDGLLSE